jgi:hypothetical protein
VIGAFLEGGEAAEFNAIKDVASLQPPAPPSGELAAAGLAFAFEVVAPPKL